MNSTYSELLKQRTELDQKIEQARKEELDSAIQQIRDLMDQYGITAQEIMPNGARTAVRRERAEDDGRRLALTETLRETLRELRALGMTTAELDTIYREEEEK